MYLLVSLAALAALAILVPILAIVCCFWLMLGGPTQQKYDQSQLKRAAKLQREKP